MIQHVSFDVWGTLISANPEYAAARTKHLAQVLGLDEAIVKRTYTSTKRYIDDMAVTSGEALSTADCFALLSDNFERPSFINAEVQNDLFDLFLKYSPTILDQTKHQIALLRSKNITCSIGSNSNFIPGRVMLPFLQREFDDAFDYGVFSDEIESAKPSDYFFGMVITRARQHGRKIVPAEILHVGDHYVCDGIGPREMGLHHVILNDVTDIQPAFRHLATLF